ncbi:MAG: glutaredoxin 3 [Nitrospirota bacterium]|jgi:glutaredoxin 3
MAKVEIYTTTICPFCDRAKALLQKKGVAYDEIDVGTNPDLRQAMVQRAGGRRTVPQIFIDGRPVGGSDDLYALEAEGRLDPMLTASAGG